MSIIKNKQKGVTLVELTIAIAIVAIAVFGIISVFKLSVTHSANPITKKQAVLISESLMEEVLSKSFTKPDGGFSGPFMASERAKFDTVNDYNGLTINGVTTLSGTAIAGLEKYSAVINVSNKALGSLASSEVKIIEITVTGPNDSFVLKGYKINDE